MNDQTRDEMRQLVKEAVSEALKGANLIDGPTHIAHHQALEEFLQTKRTVTRAGYVALAGSFVAGLLALLILGIKEWAAK